MSAKSFEVEKLSSAPRCLHKLSSVLITQSSPLLPEGQSAKRKEQSAKREANDCFADH
jgi:hypothetical protein